MKKYNRQIYLFILDNAPGKTTGELLEIVNNRFGNLFTYNTLRAYKINNGIKSGVKSGSAAKNKSLIFSPEIESFIKDNAFGITVAELTQKINEKFMTNYDTCQISGYKKRHNIKSGIDTKFKKGNVPYNKGSKMSAFTYEKCSKTMFKKGNRPHKYKPVGSEAVESKDGYIKIKIADPNVWQLKHVYLWEQQNGKVPADSVITFLDGNMRNFELDNLVCITKAENAILNKQNLRAKSAEVVSAAITLVRLKKKIAEKVSNKND